MEYNKHYTQSDQPRYSPLKCHVKVLPRLVSHDPNLINLLPHTQEALNFMCAVHSKVVLFNLQITKHRANFSCGREHIHVVLLIFSYLNVGQNVLFKFFNFHN